MDVHAILWVGTVTHTEDAGGLHAESWSDTHLGGCDEGEVCAV
jgi:hypothetical protein